MPGFRFGKHPPKVDYRTLRFRSYATAALAPPPASYNVLSQVYNNLAMATPGPLTNDGHAVYAVAYDAAGLTVLTWGNTQQATWGWWDECVDEAYAILPPEAKNPDFAPGFDLAQLQQDLSEVAS